MKMLRHRIARLEQDTSASDHHRPELPKPVIQRAPDGRHIITAAYYADDTPAPPELLAQYQQALDEIEEDY